MRGMHTFQKSQRVKKPDKLTNFYDRINPAFVKKYHNPHIVDHELEIPFRMLIIGGSGSGKTNVLLNLLQRMSGTFEKVIIVCKDADEPLYNDLAERHKKDKSLCILEGIDSIPPLDELKNCGQTLVAFDDLVLEKNQEIIKDYFIRGRKIGGGISMCYLSQDYYRIPKSIRVNANYIILKKLSSNKDLGIILREYNVGDIKTVKKFYDYATRNPLDFLLIDITASPDKRFRRGFLNNVY